MKLRHDLTASLVRAVTQICFFIKLILILKPILELPEQAHKPGKAVRFSTGSQASSPINEAITVSNMNIEFEIRNIKLE